MEHHAQSVDDALIGGLSYKHKPGASHVTNCRSFSYFASGGNGYKPSGVRVMKFNLTGDQWMDPSTFRVAFQLNHPGYDSIGTTYVQPLSWNPAVFFCRARIICAGVVLEVIDDFNKQSLMLGAGKSCEEQLMSSSVPLVMINMAMLLRIIVRVIVAWITEKPGLHLRFDVWFSSRCSVS